MIRDIFMTLVYILGILASLALIYSIIRGFIVTFKPKREYIELNVDKDISKELKQEIDKIAEKIADELLKK